MKKKTINTFDFPLKDFFVKTFKDKVFLVGGTIRDYFLYGQIGMNRDIDLVVTEHSYEDIEKKLKEHGKTNTVGKSFAVVKFTKDGNTFDISVPRKDVKKSADSHSHKNFTIECGAHISLDEDLGRRDFTCNSIAARLSDNEIFDPFNGTRAIGDKMIYMTWPETFFDDPLRILRGARFASVHNFSVDPGIYENSKDVPLDELSKERVCEELFRLLSESERPSAGLAEYWRMSVLEKLFPELYALSLTIQDAVFHPETDEFGHHTVWAHSLITVDIAKELSRRFKLDEERTLALLLAALLHDVGKPSTTRWEFKRGRMTVTSILHDVRGVDIADKFLTGLKIETRRHFPLRKTVLNLVKNHHRVFELFRNRDKIGFKAISRLVKDLEDQDFLLLLLDVADRRSREPNPLSLSGTDEILQWYLKKKEEFNIDRNTIKPIIMGRHLIKEGITPGKQMGDYLSILYDRQLDGQFKTLADGLEIFRRLRDEEKHEEKHSQEEINGTTGNRK